EGLRDRTEADRLSALFAAGNLGHRGVPGPEAVEVVTRALSAGVGRDELRRLDQWVAAQDQPGGRGAAAAVAGLLGEMRARPDWRVADLPPVAPSLERGGRPGEGAFAPPGRALGRPDREGLGPVTRGRADAPGLRDELKRGNGNGN